MACPTAGHLDDVGDASQQTVPWPDDLDAGDGNSIAPQFNTVFYYTCENNGRLVGDETKWGVKTVCQSLASSPWYQYTFPDEDADTACQTGGGWG